jgi:outer membrane protein
MPEIVHQGKLAFSDVQTYGVTYPMKSSLKLSLLATSCLLVTSLPAQAYEAGDWVFRARLLSVNPDESSSTVRASGAGIAGSGVGVDSDTVPEIDFTYMLQRNWGLELILGTSRHDVNGTGSIAPLGNIIDAKVLPPTLTLQYHFAPSSNIRPYAGAGINYTYFYDESVTGGLDASGAKVNIDDSWGLALQAGVDIDMSKDWFFNIDVKYIDIDTTAHFSNTALGAGIPVAVDVDIDPWVIGIGFGTTF